MRNFNFKKFFTNLLITFATIFTSLILIFSIISEFVYNNMNFLSNFILVSIVSFISSCILMFLFRLQRISVVLQVFIVYIFISLIVIILGYYLFIYDFIYNSRLLFATFFILLIGAFLLSLIFFVKNKKNNKSLNANLKQFKERDN